MHSGKIAIISLLLFLAFLVSGNVGHAQGGWTANLNIEPYPSPYLSDWERNPAIGQALINNGTGVTVEVRVFLTLVRRGSGEIGRASSKIFEFPPGSIQNIAVPDLVDYGTIEYDKSIEDMALRTGRLPEGEYDACIHLESVGGETLLDNVCISFTILYPDPPYLTYPSDGEAVKIEFPIFQWTPVQVPPQFDIHYNLRIAELLEGQTPDQALAANYPQYENSGILSPSLQYPIEALPLRFNHAYAWQVQVLDRYGFPPAANNGKSEIWTFRYEPDTTGPVVKRTLAGFVTEPSGSVLAGAEVVYHEIAGIEISGSDTIRTEASDSLMTTSDASGRYQLADVRDGRDFAIRASHADFAPGLLYSTERTRSGSFNNLNISLGGKPPGGRKLAGVLKNILTGEPVAQATVVYHVLDYQTVGKSQEWVENPHKALTTMTDGEGRFIFTQAADSSHFSLRASNPPVYAEIRETGIQVGDIDNYVLMISSNGCNIAGTLRVVKGGENESPGRTLVHLTRIDVVRQSEIKIFGRTIAGSGKITTITTDSGLSTYSAAEGSFIFRDIRPGDPLVIRESLIPGHPEWGQVITRSIGQYFILKVSDERFRPYVSDSIPFKAGETVETGEHLLYYKSGAIAGKVTSGGGPVAGATVYLYRSDITGIGHESGTADSSGAVPDSSIGRQADTTADWASREAGKPSGEPLDYYVTDSSGRYAFVNVSINDARQETDYYVLRVESGQYAPVSGKARLIKENDTVHVDFSLSPSRGIIHGQVADARGSGIGGARVVLYRRIDYSSVYGLLYYIYQSGTAFPVPEMKDVNHDGRVDMVDITSLIKTSAAGRIADSGGTGFGPYQQTETDDGGFYTLGNIDTGLYVINISRAGYRPFRSESFPVNWGDNIERNEVLSNAVGRLEVAVRRGDDTARGLANVTITSPNMASLYGNAYTDDSGHYENSEVMADSVNLQFKAVGYKDFDTTVLIKENETTKLGVVMDFLCGHLIVSVKDKESGAPLPNADVILGKDTIRADFNGMADFKKARVGTDTLTVAPPGSETYEKDYIIYKSPVTVYVGTEAQYVNVDLVPAARMSGTVRSKEDNKPIKDVTVFVDGNNDVSGKSDKDGNFTIRNIPTDGEIALIARKAGYKSFRPGKSWQLKPGDKIENIEIMLEKAPLDSLFGFSVVVDSLTGAGEEKKVFGALAEVPSTLGLAMKDPKTMLRFAGIAVGPDYRPLRDTVVLETSEAEVSVFGIAGKMSRGGGLLLVWDDSVKAGKIAGDITIKDILSGVFPNTSWIPFTIPASGAPAFWSGGINRGLEKYGLSTTGTEVQLKLKGVKVGIDYAKTTIDTAGLHFYGSLGLGSKITFGFDNLLIGRDDDGNIALKAITIKTTPPIKIPLGVFTVVDSATTWNSTGFLAKGAIVLDKLDKREFGFENLHISPEGDFLSVKVTASGENGEIKVYGQKFAIESLEFGTENWQSDTLPHISYFAFSGKLTVSKLEEPIEFSDLKYTERGDFTGKIGFNQTKTFAGVLSVMLKEVEFGIDGTRAEGRFVGISGGIKFGAIKGLSVQASNLRFFYDGGVTVDEIAMNMMAGPAQVDIKIKWADNVFEGSGLLTVKPIFSAGAEFRYGGSEDWWIRIISGTRIPCGAFEIVQVSGGLGRKDDTWKFSLGGVVAPARADKGISLSILVEVQKTPEGVIILGNADVTVAEKLAVGKATFELNIPKQRFNGSIIFAYDLEALKAKAQLDIGVQFGEYWFIHGKADISFLEFFKANGEIVVANNWSWEHNGQTRVMRGIYVELGSGYNISGDWYVIKWGFNYSCLANLYLTWAGDFGGKIDMSGGAYAWVGLDLGVFSIDIIEVRGNFTLGANISKTGSEWQAGAYASLGLEGTLGYCRSGGCWSICWTCVLRIFGSCIIYIPTGAKACATMHANVQYSTSKGLDVNVSF